MKNIIPKFFGVSTVGERGQIVIPNEAREKMDIKPGQKFIFFGGDSIIHMIESDQFDTIFSSIHSEIKTNISNIKNKIKEIDVDNQ